MLQILANATRNTLSNAANVWGVVARWPTGILQGSCRSCLQALCLKERKAAVWQQHLPQLAPDFTKSSPFVSVTYSPYSYWEQFARTRCSLQNDGANKDLRAERHTHTSAKADEQTEGLSESSTPSADQLPPSGSPPEVFPKQPSPPSKGLVNPQAVLHYRGVRQRPSGRFEAYIYDSARKRQLWLGTFDTAETAAHARDKAAYKLRGPAAVLNLSYKRLGIEDDTRTSRASRARTKKVARHQDVPAYHGPLYHGPRYRGVIPRPTKFGFRFAALIRDPAKGGRLWLGTHATAEAAAHAYDRAAIDIKGPAAVVNFPHSSKDRTGQWDVTWLVPQLSRTGLAAQEAHYVAVLLHAWLQRKQPSSWPQTFKSLLERVEHLQHLLDGPMLARVLRRCPRLLDLKADTIKQHFEGLRQLLALPKSRLQRLVTCQPSLLVSTPGSLHQRVQQLGALLAMEHAEVLPVVVSHPRLLILKPQTLSKKMEEVAQLLDLPRPRVAQLFRRQPVLFALSAASIEAKAKLLQTLLGLSQEELLTFLFMRAGILTSSLPSLQDKYHRLHAMLGPDTCQVLMTDCRLLSCSMEVLRQRWKSLETLAYENAAWKQELARMPAYCKAVWLSSPTRYNRLAFLIGSNKARDLSLVTAITLPTRTFADWYPDYRGWTLQGHVGKLSEAMITGKVMFASTPSKTAGAEAAAGKRRKQKHAVELTKI